MLGWLFSREKAAYELGRKKGYEEGYADHTERTLSILECPNPNCTKYRSEWREAQAIGYGNALRDLQLALDGTHSFRAAMDAPGRGGCTCEICKTIREYQRKLIEVLERTVYQYFLPDSN